QSVTFQVFRLAEIDTPAFKEFLREAAASFHANVKRLQTKPEDLMPWKLHGERWHLGEKGFPPGKKLRWDRALLPRLLELVREVEPALEIRWDSRQAITVRVPGITRGWANWRTKESEGLIFRFFGKKGQNNPSELQVLAEQPSNDGKLHLPDLLEVQSQHVEQ